MKRSFNQIRKIGYSLLMDPLTLPSLFSVGVFYTALFRGAVSITLLSLLLVLTIVALSYTRQHGYPNFLAKRLSTYFFSFKLFSGRWVIFQRKTKRQKNLDCRQILRSLAKDADSLSEMLTALPGRYRAITHETVINRLRRMERADITMCKPIYTATLAETISALTGKRCRRCKDKCPYHKQRTQQRQFYDVWFEIK